MIKLKKNQKASDGGKLVETTTQESESGEERDSDVIQSDNSVVTLEPPLIQIDSGKTLKFSCCTVRCSIKLLQ